MARFIKLTNMLINTNDIHKILINQNKYYIQFISNNFNGYMCLFSGSGFGNISSPYYEIEVCENKHPNDYKIVSEWINRL